MLKISCLQRIFEILYISYNVIPLSEKLVMVFIFRKDILTLNNYVRSSKSFELTNLKISREIVNNNEISVFLKFE